MKLRVLRRVVVASAATLGCLAGLMAPAAHADTLPFNTPSSPVPAFFYANGCSVPGPNVLFDAHVLPDPAPWHFFYVSFRQACDLHDAGYDGGIVFDPRTGVIIDTTRMSRAVIDSRFFIDLIRLCGDQIPFYAGVALSTCYGLAGTYYTTVRVAGAFLFDASPAVAGRQFTGTRPNN